MATARNERGVSNSLQFVLLLPLAFGVFLLVLQWGLVFWADATALAAAQEGAAVAAVLDGSVADGNDAALEAAGNGSLSGVMVEIERGARETTATVTGEAVSVLWPRSITKTVVVITERIT